MSCYLALAQLVGGKRWGMKTAAVENPQGVLRTVSGRPFMGHVMLEIQSKSEVLASAELVCRRTKNRFGFDDDILQRSNAG